AAAGRVPRQPLPRRGGARLRREPPGGGADRALPLREPRPAPVPAGRVRDHQGRDQHRLEDLPAPAAARVAAAGAHAAHGAHRERLGAVHLREQGGDRALPGDREGDPARPPGVRAPGRDVDPQAPARGRRGEEARLHREVHPAGRDRPAADPRVRREGAGPRGREPHRRTRAQPEDVSVAARKKAPAGPPRGRAGKAAKKAPVAAGDVQARNRKLDGSTVDLIRKTASGVHDEIRAHKKPDLAFPVRSLKNVSYSQDTGYFEMGRHKKVRTLTVNTVKSFAQTLRMMGLSKELVESNDFATKRDAYYQSKNWEEARFDDQTESDTVMDDIEALFSVQGLSREQLRFVPDEHG